MVGAVISRPGAGVQRFHCDADLDHLAAAKDNPSHRLYNVFIPLVDISANSDGTEFWGSPQLEGSPDALARHFISESAEQISRQQKDASLVPDQIVSPGCRAGGIIIYDYRTIHRGLPNPVDGRERPMVYVIVATGGAGKVACRYTTTGGCMHARTKILSTVLYTHALVRMHFVNMHMHADSTRSSQHGSMSILDACQYHVHTNTDEGYNFPEKSVKDHPDPDYIAEFPFFRDLDYIGYLNPKP